MHCRKLKSVDAAKYKRRNRVVNGSCTVSRLRSRRLVQRVVLMNDGECAVATRDMAGCAKDSHAKQRIKPDKQPATIFNSHSSTRVVSPAFQAAQSRVQLPLDAPVSSWVSIALTFIPLGSNLGGFFSDERRCFCALSDER